MDAGLNDTHPEAERIRTELLRRKSPGERVLMGQRIRAGAEMMAESRLRREYPKDTARQRQLRIAALRYGDEVMKRVFDWDPEVEGR